jgi:hypothetical protein
LPNFRSLFVEIGQMLFADLLIGLELLLGADFFARSKVSLPQPVVSVGRLEFTIQIRAGMAGLLTSVLSPLLLVMPDSVRTAPAAAASGS